MLDKFHHEKIYRGDEALKKLNHAHLTICGAGAVGSHLITNLTRQGIHHITVIDFDRIEPHNVGTQTYAESDIGMFKVHALQTDLFRAVGIEIKAVQKKLTEKNIKKLLKGAELVIDSFDNHEARKLLTEYCRMTTLPCLHVGLNADYAEIVWNNMYTVPKDIAQDDICNYPMARNLIQFAAALASEALVRFILKQQRQSFSFTLNDLKINVIG